MRTELLNLLAPHVAQKGSLSEHYEGVWLQASGGKITAQSIGRYGQTWTQGECPWDWQARVSAESLLRALKASSGDPSSIKVDAKNRLEIVVGRQTVRLPTYPEPEWGPAPELKDAKADQLIAEDFTGVAAASDESDKKATCNGVQVEDGWMFATDAYRLHAAKTTIEGPLRIPRTVESVMKANGGQVFNVDYDSQRFKLHREGLTHVTSLIGRPPMKWQALLRERSIFLEFEEEDAVAFIAALQRSSRVTDSAGMFRVDEGVLTLATADEASEVALRDEEDFGLTVGFNIGYLLDAIQFVGWDDVLTLEFTDEKSPIVLQREGRLTMVMPVRV